MFILSKRLLAGVKQGVVLSPISFAILCERKTVGFSCSALTLWVEWQEGHQA